MVDYFVDYDPSQPERSPKIFSVYEDFHCNLRDIIEFRREHKLGFIEPHVLKILQDLVNGVNSLHMLGSPAVTRHRAPQPQAREHLLQQVRKPVQDRRLGTRG